VNGSRAKRLRRELREAVTIEVHDENPLGDNLVAELGMRKLARMYRRDYQRQERRTWRSSPEG